MRFLLRFRSIKAKLTAFGVTLVVLALALCGLVLSAVEISSFGGSAQLRMSALARVLAAGCARAVAAGDRAAAGHVLNSIRDDPDVTGAGLYMADSGERFASVGGSEAPIFPERLRPPASTPPGRPTGIRWASAPVRVGGKRAATLVVGYSLNGMWPTLGRYAVVLGTAVVVAGTGAILVAQRLSRSLAAPIEAVSTAATEMARYREYSRRVTCDTRDELRTLVDAFNTLASEIEKRESDLQTANRELEERAASQTRHLIAAYEASRDARELIERRRLESEILEISNRERSRIAHDLHDDLGQRLASMALIAKAAAMRLGDGSSAEAAQLAALVRSASDAVLVVRRIAHGLDPLDAGEKDLPDALNELVRQVQQTTPIGFWIRLSDPPPSGLDQAVATVLYRIAQEAINNAIRHSGATNIVVELRHADDAAAVELRVTDDGVGLKKNPSANGGLGLKIMHFRAASVGGTLSVESLGVQGTAVTCRVPKAPRPAPGSSAA